MILKYSIPLLKFLFEFASLVCLIQVVHGIICI